MNLNSNQLGRLGETAVALELQKRGFDVINLNDAIKNYEGADLFCASPKSGKSTLIQVKTGTTKNIQCGITSTPDGVIENLDKKINCPWVFVYVEPKENNDFSFEFYILTRDETYELIDKSNHWYTLEWSRKLEKNVHVGIELKWLKGESSKESDKLHPAFISTLKETTFNKWDKLGL